MKYTIGIWHKVYKIQFTTKTRLSKKLYIPFRNILYIESITLPLLLHWLMGPKKNAFEKMPITKEIVYSSTSKVLIFIDYINSYNKWPSFPILDQNFCMKNNINLQRLFHAKVLQVTCKKDHGFWPLYGQGILDNINWRSNASRTNVEQGKAKWVFFKNSINESYE